MEMRSRMIEGAQAVVSTMPKISWVAAPATPVSRPLPMGTSSDLKPVGSTKHRTVSKCSGEVPSSGARLARSPWRAPEVLLDVAAGEAQGARHLSWRGLH